MNTPHNLSGLTLWAVPRFRRQMEPIYPDNLPSLKSDKKNETAVDRVALTPRDHRMVQHLKIEI